MSKKRKRLIKAVAYLRRSTTDQEASLDEQRATIIAYAKANGYRIIRWYEDDGISGDDTEKRVGFLRMIDDATSGEFKFILCWDQDRFGRFDSLEAGYYITPIRNAGVQLVTVNEGPIDWNNFADRLTYSIKQEGKHQFLRDLSRNVLRGQSEAAKQGSWIGSPPYGYLLEGNCKNKRLVVDEPRMAIVRRLFKEYVDDGRSLSEIAKRLTDEGEPTPKGKRQWRGDTVRFLLANPAYIGTFRYNTAGSSKYHSFRRGAIAQGGYRGRKPVEDWVVIPNHHPAEIDKDAFDRAQAMIAKNRNGQTNYPAGDNPYIFSGVLRCGRCGALMIGDDGNRYRCGNRRAKKRCLGTVVREDHLLEHLTRTLNKHLIDDDPEMLAAEWSADRWELRPEDVPKTFERMRRIMKGNDGRDFARDAKRLRAKIAKIDTQLAKLRRNIGYVDDPATITVISEEIEKHEEERGTLQRQIESQPTEINVNYAVLDLIGDMMHLHSGNKAVVRRVVREVDRITVHTHRRGKGNGTRHRLKSIEITWLGVGPTASKSNSRRTD